MKEKGSGRPKTSEEMVVRNLAKPKEIVTKNKSGIPDSTNNSLAHAEHDNETLQATTRSSHNDRGQAKVCHVSGGAHIEHA